MAVCSAEALAKYSIGTVEHFKKFGAKEADGCWYGFDGVNTVIWAQDPKELFKGQLEEPGMSATQMIGWGVLALAVGYGIYSATRR